MIRFRYKILGLVDVYIRISYYWYALLFEVALWLLSKVVPSTLFIHKKLIFVAVFNGENMKNNESEPAR